MAMNDPEFDEYLEQALDELEAKQTALKSEFGLGQHGRFVVDYAAGILTFLTTGLLVPRHQFFQSLLTSRQNVISCGLGPINNFPLTSGSCRRK